MAFSDDLKAVGGQTKNIAKMKADAVKQFHELAPYRQKAFEAARALDKLYGEEIAPFEKQLRAPESPTRTSARGCLSYRLSET
jgi:hypothetical protein